MVLIPFHSNTGCAIECPCLLLLIFPLQYLPSIHTCAHTHTHLHSYCNHRILKLTPTGEVLQEWRQPVEGVFLYIPHSLALSKSEEELYVADRENGRIITYSTLTGHPLVSRSPDKLKTVYGIAFNGSGSWPLYAIGGQSHAFHGVTIDESGEISSIWAPKDVRPWPVHNVYLSLALYYTCKKARREILRL